jgi:tetratricopeptide (TPR) repeat protein
MDKYTLINLLDNPHTISENDLESLEEIVASYPYCQTAHLLIAKYTHEKESILATQKIRRAAAYALDRNILRKFVNNFQPQLPETTIEQEAKIEIKNETPVIATTQIADNQVISQEISASNFIIDNDEPDDTKSFFEMIDLDEPAENLNFAPAKTESNSSFTFLDENTVQFNLDKSNEVFAEPKNEIPFEIIAETPILPSEPNLDYLEQVIDNQPVESISSNPEIDPFFADIDNFPHIEGHEIYEDINVGKALGLFYDDKISESIRMFNQLMRLYPAKKPEYQEELLDLLGKKAHLYNLETGELKNQATPVTTVSSLVEEIKPIELDIIEPQISDNKVVNQIVEPDLPFIETPNSDEDTSFQNESLDSSYSLDERDLPLETISNLNGYSNGKESQTADNQVVIENSPEIEAQNEKPSEASFFDQIADNEIVSEDFNRNFTPNAHITEVSIATETPKINVIADLSDFAPKNLQPETEKTFFTESEAILLFNQGKNAEAIKIYESLIERNPQKAAYYQSQIKVLQGMDINRLRETEQNINLAVETSEDFSEAQALQLFTQGKTQEAVSIYEQLISKHPEKRAYFISQIEILKS